MLDFVIGTKAKPGAVDDLIDALRGIDIADGILYVGYPLVSTDNETAAIDALLTSAERGVTIFDLIEQAPNPEEWKRIEEREDRLVAGLTSRLLLFKGLQKRGRLAFEIASIAYAPFQIEPPEGSNISVASRSNLPEALDGQRPLADGLLVYINAALQNVSTIKPRKKRVSVRGIATRGAVLKEIEKSIANLDPWQRRGAIETPDGPQRIRGIAGSGKTIVLALKAAYLHAQHPDWTIAVTFQTRSLYQQFRDLITRFYFDQQKDEPDWSQLRVLHAWGSNRAPGVYSEIASAGGFPSQSLTEARVKYSRNQEFEGICTELLAACEKAPIPPIFDALLIDEAQDLPTPFFRLAYKATKEPKRIVWAYDELQNLGTYAMAPQEELFGEGNGAPLVLK